MERRIPAALANAEGGLRYRVGVSAPPALSAAIGGLRSAIAAAGLPVEVVARDERAVARPSDRLDHIFVLREGPAAVAASDMLREIRSRFFEGRVPEYATLFRNGEDGYAAFRIPSLLMAGNRLLAFCEARSGLASDAERNDIVLRASEDGGRTWGPLLVVATDGDASLNNPTGIWLEEEDRVLLLFQRYPPSRGERSTAKGVEGEKVCRVLLARSEDRGATWAAPVDITRYAKSPEMSAVASGPGRAVRAKAGPDAGRILVPFNSSGMDAGWYDYLVASDDGGESWRILAGRSWYGANESQLVQVGEREFLVNARSHRWKGGSASSPPFWSPWLIPATDRKRSSMRVRIEGDEAIWGEPLPESALPDPLCQGSILRWSGLDGSGERSLLLFSNPANSLPLGGKAFASFRPPARVNGTVRASYDEGASWPVARRVYGDPFTGFQYSALERLPEDRVGLLFECWPEIKFAGFGLEWLEAGRPR